MPDQNNPIDSIQDVVNHLSEIIADARAHNSPLGYFAATYQIMTKAVQKGIQDGAFQNVGRMERLDVVFAKRYFDALAAWQSAAPCSLAWAKAFEATKDSQLTTLQQILLGINAHIHLDLGIAAATVAPGEAIESLRPDFDQINVIISGLIDGVQERLSRFTPVFYLFDSLLKDADEQLVRKVIETGRAGAWSLANVLAAAPSDEHALIINKADQGVAFLADAIQAKKSWAAYLFGWLRRSEKGSTSEKIDALLA